MTQTYWIYGHHAVQGALGNPRRRVKRLVALDPGTFDTLRVPAVETQKVTKDFFLKTLGDAAVHQGIALEVYPLEPLAIESLASLEGNVLVGLLDHVTDPQNVGAIMRSAAAFGVHALIVTERHSPPLNNPLLTKTASGAADRVAMISVVNMNRALAQLKEMGFWIVGLDEEGQRPMAKDFLGGKVGFVLGAEGKGMRRLTKEGCDFLCHIPTHPDFSTLNVTHAATIAFHTWFTHYGQG